MDDLSSYVASLYPAMMRSTIKAKFTIKNTTSEPLFLVWDNQTRPALSDDKYAFSALPAGTPTGMPSASINQSGIDKEETYTKLAVGQTHAIGLVFMPELKGSKASGQSRVTVTMNFIRLNNGKVERIPASPCALMKVGD
jgi:hypothetical protein